jgi:hypothetical protein
VAKHRAVRHKRSGNSGEIRQQLDNEVVRQQWDNEVVRKIVVGQPIFAMSLGGTGQPIPAILEGRIVQSNLAITIVSK